MKVLRNSFVFFTVIFGGFLIVFAVLYVLNIWQVAQQDQIPFCHDAVMAWMEGTPTTRCVEVVSSTLHGPTFIRYSYYWPPLGGPNCAIFHHGRCTSNTANGARWQDWIGKGIACPPEWPFGTKIVFEGETWTCVDRGGKIQYEDGIPWIDFLTPRPMYSYGTVVRVEVK